MQIRWIIVLFLGSLWACSQLPAAALKSPTMNVPITVVYEGNQCPCDQSELQVKRLTRQSEIDGLVQQGSRNTIGLSKQQAPQVDFSQDMLVAIWMGKKPTTGFQLRLDKEVAEIKNNRAVIQLNLTEPKADETMTGQMITSPCLLLRLPKGGYNTIELLSQEQTSLAKLTLSASK